MLKFAVCFPSLPLQLWVWKGKVTLLAATTPVPAHPVPSLSLQVILKDLEVLAEIASSPAGQTEGHGPSDSSDVRPGPVELHIPARTSQLSSSGECCSSGSCFGDTGLCFGDLGLYLAAECCRGRCGGMSALSCFLQDLGC